MLKGLFGGGRGAVPETKLPQPGMAIEALVSGRAARSVVVEHVGAKSIVTSSVVGRTGEGAVLVYVTAAGRFRAQTKISGTSGTSTEFDLPKDVTLVGATGEQKRRSVRLDSLVGGSWRIAPGGRGIGPFIRGSLRDLSRSGCSLIADRPIKPSQTIELQLQLRNDHALTLLAEVVRHDVVATSGKHSHGLRFTKIRPDEDQAIVDFINRKQAELRSRGLA